MQGYWDLPEQNDRVFFTDRNGVRWYRTGDVVSRDADGNYRFLGRRDRMIKKRGYRIELGEIESVLYTHPSVKEVAAVARENDDGVSINAFVSTKEGHRFSLIAIKRFCAEQLPLYMVPDTFTFLPELPKTSTDKIAYQELKACLEDASTTCNRSS
jgi:acyl-coenzyme A synthetase/AMP-(fatty) acid ligase